MHLPQHARHIILPPPHKRQRPLVTFPPFSNCIDYCTSGGAEGGEEGFKLAAKGVEFEGGEGGEGAEGVGGDDAGEFVPGAFPGGVGGGGVWHEL